MSVITAKLVKVLSLKTYINLNFPKCAQGTFIALVHEADNDYSV